jgi:hypothetical protein
VFDILLLRSSKYYQFHASKNHHPALACEQNWFGWLDDDVGRLRGAISIGEKERETERVEEREKESKAHVFSRISDIL